jgi:hypothetical protein
VGARIGRRDPTRAGGGGGLRSRAVLRDPAARAPRAAPCLVPCGIRGGAVCRRRVAVTLPRA